MPARFKRKFSKESMKLMGWYIVNLPGLQQDEEVRKEQVKSILMKRATEPREITRLAVFLASSDADYVTGSTYVMDGGLMQNMGQGA